MIRDTEFAYNICKQVAFMGGGILMMDWGRVNAFLFNPFLEVPSKGAGRDWDWSFHRDFYLLCEF